MPIAQAHARVCKAQIKKATSPTLKIHKTSPYMHKKMFCFLVSWNSRCIAKDLLLYSNTVQVPETLQYPALGFLPCVNERPPVSSLFKSMQAGEHTAFQPHPNHKAEKTSMGPGLLLWQGFPLRIQPLSKWWEKLLKTTSSLHMTKWMAIPTALWTE